jgi:hypothetical protein
LTQDFGEKERKMKPKVEGRGFFSIGFWFRNFRSKYWRKEDIRTVTPDAILGLEE